MSHFGGLCACRIGLVRPLSRPYPPFGQRRLSARFCRSACAPGFVTSALEDGADLFKVMDVTRHREVKTLKAYDRRAKAFKDHAGKGFL